VKRLINAQSHFGQLDMNRLESREKLIQLKSTAKRFHIQGKDFLNKSNSTVALYRERL